MKKILLVTGLLLVAAYFTVLAATTSVVTGSFFVSSGTNALGGTNGLGGTNCFVLAPGVSSTTTNFATTGGSNVNTINISGCGAVALLADYVGVTASTQLIRLCLQLSLDGTNFTSGSNGCLVDLPGPGATRTIWTTNFGTTAFTPYSYMRLGILAQHTTNNGAVTFSNLNYRFLQTPL